MKPCYVPITDHGVYVTPFVVRAASGRARVREVTTDLEAIFREQLRVFFLSSDELAEYLEQADEQIVLRF